MPHCKLPAHHWEQALTEICCGIFGYAFLKTSVTECKELIEHEEFMLRQ